MKCLEKYKLFTSEEKIKLLNEFLMKFKNEMLTDILIKSYISKDLYTLTYFQVKNFAKYINENFKIGQYI